MNAIALIVVAALSAGTVACEILTDVRQAKQAPKNAFAGLTRYMAKLKGHVDFVTEHGGVYRFHPKGVYRGITYDGGILTDLVPDEATNSFTVVTRMYVHRQWSVAESKKIGAVELLNRLGRNEGTALGVPAGMRREMSTSAIHRRIVCGIPLSEEAKQAPK